MSTHTTAATGPVAAEKPLLRGWIHAVTAPVALIVGVVLVSMADGPARRAAAAVFALSAVMLFTASAVYHRGRWSPSVRAWLRRIDHSMIYVLIAGTYTAFAVVLEPRYAAALLVIVWGGALAGVAFRLVWLSAPRWSYVGTFIALGWVAVWFAPQFAVLDGTVVALLAAGGLIYTIGAVAYALRWPDPLPRVFGFHELFHAKTVLAFACHSTAAALVLWRLTG